LSFKPFVSTAVFHNTASGGKMTSKALFAIFAMTLFCSAVNAETMVAEGVVESITGNNVTFRKAKDTLMLSLSALEPATQKLVQELAGQNRRTKLTIDSAAILTSVPLAIGIRPDCSEIPVTYDDLVNLAKKPGIKSTLDFLKEMPAGSMQTFTLVHSSNSVQKEGVDTNWPRVLRMSADGKIIFSYTCRPEAPTYNSIEMMRFDDSVNGYKFTSINFRGKAESDIRGRVTRIRFLVTVVMLQPNINFRIRDRFGRCILFGKASMAKLMIACEQKMSVETSKTSELFVNFKKTIPVTQVSLGQMKELMPPTMTTLTASRESRLTINFDQI
jgi:hypothetical protein